jgi:hypothetical protein
MSEADDLFCNRVITLLESVGQASMALGGRALYNMFSLYGAELQRDVHDLIIQGCMSTDLQPLMPDNTVILPGFAPRNARRMRYLWDYFIFIYMSHKVENIFRRQASAGTGSEPILLYLRGRDYQFAMAQDGAAVGHTTMDDTHFRLSILSALSRRFKVVKAISPSDLTIAMAMIGEFLARHGNRLSSVAEFARVHQDGLFLNRGNWKEQVLGLFSSTSLFLVYISNQSKGLMFELENLVVRGLEAHSILVLDDNRFGSRDSFFAAQERLKQAGRNLYLSVDRDACAVEDPDAFERLLLRFPHRVTLGKNKEKVLSDIELLIPAALRIDPAAPEEVPFEFRVALNAAEEEHLSELRRVIGNALVNGFSGETITNWSVVLLHTEIDIFLSLALGDILSAAASTARYGAIADCAREVLTANAPERAFQFDAILEGCGATGSNSALTAYALGNWNDYDDRRGLAEERVNSIADEVRALMNRSIKGAGTVVVRNAGKEDEEADPSTYSDLLRSSLDSMGMLKNEEEDD